MTKKQQISHIMAYVLLTTSTFMGLSTMFTGDIPYRTEVSMFVNTLIDGW